MDNKEIQSIIQEAVEKEIPTSEIDLWQTVKAGLVEKHYQQGVKMNTTKSRGASRLVYATLAIIALLMLTFLTPQGRAFAQTFLQLFTRAERMERSLPEGQVPSLEDAQFASTAQPPAPIVDMAEAERIAGFDAKELPVVPQGFEFYGAMPIGDGISIQYQAQGNGGQLVINESKNGFMQSDWDQAPEDAITQVKINGLDAEIVQGMYVVYPGEGVAKWNPDAPILRLRWIEDGIWFEMAKFGGVESIAYLNADGMIALAESMTYAP